MWPQRLLLAAVRVVRRGFASSAARNVGIIAHIDAGKTTTTERMLLLTGATRFAGEVDAGDAVMDYLEEERTRGITIQSAATSFKWLHHQVNLIDTPGHVDFTIEVERVVRVIDGAALIVDAVAGAQAQTETVWRQARRYGVPAIAYVNKMDREGADFRQAAASLAERLQLVPVLMQLPLFDGAGRFCGVLDLVEPRALLWASPTADPAKRAQRGAAQLLKELSLAEADAVGLRSCGVSKGGTLEEMVEEYRTALFEQLVQLEDDESQLTELFLAERTPAPPQLRASIRSLTRRGAVVPTLCGASLQGVGVEPLLDSMIHYLPSPVERPQPLLRRAQSAAGLATQRAAAAAAAAHAAHAVQLAPLREAAGAVALAFKVVHDRHSRRPVVWLRVYSGELRSSDTLLNSANGKTERLGRLLKMRGEESSEQSIVGAGDIVAVLGLKHTRTGDTLLLSPASGSNNLSLDGVAVPPPVFFCALEIESASDQSALDEALASVQLEDPSVVASLDRSTGQQLLGGMGELHLEVVCKRISSEHKLKLHIGPMRVAYREGVASATTHVSTHSAHLKEDASAEVTVTLRVEPTLESISQSTWLPIGLPTGQAGGSNGEGSASVHAAEPAHGTVSLVVDEGLCRRLSATELDAVLEGLQGATQYGELLGFPLHALRVTLQGLKRPQSTPPEALAAAAADALGAAIKEAGALVLEPLMKIEVQLPEHHVGGVLSELTNARRSNIEQLVAPTGGSTRHTVRALAPLARLVGFASDLRSQTRGEAALSLEFSHYAPLDPHSQQQLMDQIRGY